MYAVVAPGFSCIYHNWSDVERIKALYPYPKWGKFSTEAQAQEFIKRNTCSKQLKEIYNYGNTLSTMYLDVKYRIGKDCLFYTINTKRVGTLRVSAPNALVEYRGSMIFVKVPNVKLSDESIAGHMSAIYSLLELVGEYVDVNIEIPNYSIFYCLTVYSKGNNRSVQLTRDAISKRLCEVAFTLKLKE